MVQPCAPRRCFGTRTPRACWRPRAPSLALRGVPAIYLPTLLAGAQRSSPRVEETGDQPCHQPRPLRCHHLGTGPRRIPARSSPRSSRDERLLWARRLAAFHPEGAQRILDAGRPSVLAVERTAPPGGRAARGPRAGCSAVPVRFAARARPRPPPPMHGAICSMALAGSPTHCARPYQVRWLADAAAHEPPRGTCAVALREERPPAHTSRRLARAALLPPRRGPPPDPQRRGREARAGCRCFDPCPRGDRTTSAPTGPRT